MTLKEVLEKVKEHNLDKSQLEEYHTMLCNLKAELKQEYATLKKKKALFLLNRSTEDSVASADIKFSASPDGQRKFEVEGYLGSVNAMIDSIKSRLYSQY